jgi:serine-type D-Ala-D-Ala carboxypeptidase
MTFDSTHEIMRSGLMQEIFTAAALLVIHHDELVFHNAYGTLSGPGSETATTRTLFDMASVTKVLATTPVWIQLESESPGIIDEPLVRWFHDTPPDKASITPRQLLAHASGLPAWRPYYLMTTSAPHSENVRVRILSEPLAYTPGLGCIYSDLGFMLLAFIIEKETGESLDVCAAKRIFEPLGLNDIMFKPLAQKHRIAWTRVDDTPGVVNDLNSRALGGVAGHAGLFATAECAGRLALELLRSHNSGGFFNTPVVRMFSRKACLTVDSTRALGFDTATEASSCGRFFSGSSVGHTGFTGTSLWVDLDRELIVVLLTNRVVNGESDFRIKDFRPLVHDSIMQAVRYT